MKSNLMWEKIYASKQRQTPDMASLNLPSGNMIVCQPGQETSVKKAAFSVAPGIYDIDVFYLDPETMKTVEALPSLGIHFIIVHFNDNPVDSWHEYLDTGGRPVPDDGDMISLVIADAESAGAVARQSPVIIERTYTDGFGNCENDLGFIAYIGEVALEHHFAWASDSQGNPVKFAAYFRYPDEKENWTKNEPDTAPLNPLLHFNMGAETFDITVPEDVLPFIAIDAYDDACYITTGKGFEVTISRLINSADNSDLEYITKYRNKIMESGTLKRLLIDEPTRLMWETSDRKPADFRFITAVKKAGSYYEIKEYYPDGPYSEADISRMMQAAGSFQ